MDRLRRPICSTSPAAASVPARSCRQQTVSLAGPLEQVVAELQLAHYDRRIDLEVRLAQPVNYEIERIAQFL